MARRRLPMRSSDRALTPLVLMLVGLLVGLFSVAAWGQTAQGPTAPPAAAEPNAQPLSDKDREDFRTKMLGVPLPDSGCFEAKYPNATWNKVPCGPPPKSPYPLGRRVRPTNVGNGTGYFARVAGNITSATGSFDNPGTTGITAVYSPMQNGASPRTVYANTYSLQLNADGFNTPACGGVAGCGAWQQFIFSQRSACGGTPCVVIQYWLIGKLPCNPPWQSYVDPSGATVNGCYQSSPTMNLPTTPAIGDLGSLALTGKANLNGNDVVTLQTADGHLYATTYPDNTLNLAQAWTGAEFNIFGDCCAYEVFLNNGSNLKVRLSTTSTNAPTCTQNLSNFAAETNNLNLVAGSCVPGPGSAIAFTESGGEKLPPPRIYRW